MNLTPTIGKRPILRNWQTGHWDGQVKRKQDGVGFVNGQDGIICLDYDKPEIFDKHKDVLLKHSVIQTQKGYHVYVKPIEPLHGNVQFVDFGEIRMRNSQNIFPYDLPFSNKYKHITPFVPKDISTDELKELIIPYYKKSVTLVEVLELELGLDLSFSVLRFLPIEQRTNHNLMLSLVRGIYSSGNWSNKDILIKEWIFLNQFKRHTDDAYLHEFEDILKSFNPNKAFSINSLFNRFNSITLNSKWKSEQKRVDWIVEEMFIELGKRGQFAFSTRFRWNEHIVSDRIHPQMISRAIERLVDSNKAICVVPAWKWSSNKKMIHCAEYKLVVL